MIPSGQRGDYQSVILLADVRVTHGRPHVATPHKIVRFASDGVSVG